MKKHRGFILAVIGYCILIGFIFSKALIPSDGMMIYGDDIHRSYYFFREFFNQWISQGIFPWWNPYLFGENHLSQIQWSIFGIRQIGCFFPAS